MQKNSQNFSMQDAMQLANNPAAQQLLALLQNSDPDALRKAMAQAAAGDYAQAKQVLTPLFASEDAKKLLEQIGG